MKKIFNTNLFIFLFVTTGFAQRDAFAFAWEVNVPANSGYLTKTSWAGGKLEYRHFIQKNISVGLAMNWASYEQYFNRQTYQKPDGNSAVTSDFDAQVYTLPLTLTGHYYFERSHLIRPFVGVALGGQYMEQRLFYNVYETDLFNWGFVARPEAGIFITPEHFSGWGFLIGLNYSFATNENGINKKNSFNNFGLTIGMGFGE